MPPMEEIVYRRTRAGGDLTDGVRRRIWSGILTHDFRYKCACDPRMGFARKRMGLGWNKVGMFQSGGRERKDTAIICKALIVSQIIVSHHHGAPRASNFLLIVLFSILAAAANSYSIRVASWNVLSPSYIVPEKYPWCHADYLDWSHRKVLLAEKIASIQAGVICLQEVPVDGWEELLELIEGQAGDGCSYQGILQNVTQGHPAASAVLIRKGVFQDGRQNELEVVRVESRSRALIVVLRAKTRVDDHEPAPHLYLANVHLEAGMEHENNLVRYNQLKSLWKRLKYHCTMIDKSSLCESSIVMAGDFNMLYTNALHSFLTLGLLETIPKHKPVGVPIVTTKLKDAYLSFNLDRVISDQAKGLFDMQMLTVWSGRTRHVDDETLLSELASNTHFADSLLGGSPLRSTFRSGCVLDYIWVSQKIRITNALILDPGAFIPCHQEWPSKTYPSDHLPIGADLEWP